MSQIYKYAGNFMWESKNLEKIRGIYQPSRSHQAHGVPLLQWEKTFQLCLSEQGDFLKNYNWSSSTEFSYQKENEEEASYNKTIQVN